MSTGSVRVGLDSLQADGFSILHGQRVGLVAHPASVDSGLRHAVDILHGAAALDLRCLFGPQHGLRGETQDNMIEWEGFRDPGTALEVYSLYGEHRKPTAEMLAGIDTLVVDLQDVGARYYTFIWTLLLCMQACAEEGKRLVVLDRPNPIGGAREGNVLAMEYSSFVGLAPIPMRHGLTIGELARWFRAHFALELDLRVVELQGWRRSWTFESTGLPWVLPSPNLPTPQSALVYPGMCLLEGTELSEGRGTTRPFEIFGAPFIDPRALVTELERRDLPGAIFRPLHFEPTFNKHAGRLCGGAQIHVLDPQVFRPVRTALAILTAIRDLWAGELRWLSPPYEYEREKLPIDILAGGSALREALESGGDPLDLEPAWEAELAAFGRDLRSFELYA